MRDLFQKLKHIIFPKEISHHQLKQIVEANIDRLRWMILLFIPVNIIHIVLFGLQSSQLENASEQYWNQGIIISHALFLLYSLCIGVITQWKRGNYRVEKIINKTILPSTMLFGLALASLDQLVATNITPYLVACMVASIIFLTTPIYATIIFVSGYVLFFFLQGFFQYDANILLSNRVNGITFTAIGIFISVIGWNRENLLRDQQHMIRQQTKELMRKNEKLEELSSIDLLTQLLNRRKFEEQIAEEITKLPDKDEISIALIDIDYFKSINDTYGHGSGDLILMEMGLLIQQFLIESAFASRWGGEEFLLAFPSLDKEEIYNYMEKLRSAIEEHPFYVEDSSITHITVSIGVASQQKKDGLCNFRSCVQEADLAMYRAKKLGKNRVELYSSQEQNV